MTLGMAGMLAAPPAHAATAGCVIINQAAGARYNSLQAAQDAASAGATLQVRGTCVDTTRVSKNLTITGQRAVGFGAPTLDGKRGGSVLTIGSGIMVTVNTLTITDGSSIFGGGIDNSGTLTINDSRITGNLGPIHGDGAIYNSDFGTLTLDNSSVTGNALAGGVFNAGTLTMNDSRITGNSSYYGGGLYNDFASATLNQGSSITGNTARSHFGGGVFNYGSRLALNGSRISGNTAGLEGGGVFNFGTVTMSGSRISGNTAGRDGGGIYNGSGSVTLHGSSITGNTAGHDGGGVYNLDTVTLHNSSVTGNRPDNVS